MSMLAVYYVNVGPVSATPVPATHANLSPAKVLRHDRRKGWLVGFRGRRGAEGRSGPVHRAVSAEENGTVEQRSARHRDLFPPGVVYTELHQRFSGRKEKRKKRRCFRAFSLD